MCQLIDIHIRSGGGAPFRYRPSLRLCQPRYHAQSHADFGHAVRARLQRAIPLAARDINWAEHNAIAPRIIHELRGGIKSHGPAIEKPGNKSGWSMTPQPRGRVY